MTITEKFGHQMITAGNGFFLRNRNSGLYGESIILGIYDRPENYDELPMSEYPEEPVVEDPDNEEND